MEKVKYEDSGVSISKGNSFVEEIKPFVKKTFDANVIGGIGSFAGAYKIPKGYKNPVILGATDGVGTKLKLAIEAKRFDTVGIDLVAMCTNDLICNFAKPMFFLDYYATSKLEIEEAKDVVEGISVGCILSQCALIGGETAEMPGMYQYGDFDLAGFSVGIAEENEIDRIAHVKDGDVLVALASSGAHSNGYSLIRHLLFEKLDKKFDDQLNGKKLIDILLEPTRIYVKEFLNNKDDINALAHITGGGITENLPRVLPENLKAVVFRDKIKVLDIFKLMSEYIEEDEMYRTFNMGIGMVLVVNPKNVDKILANTDGYVIGHIESGNKGVEFK